MEKESVTAGSALVSTNELRSWLEGPSRDHVHIIDTRAPDVFAQGHIAGAVNIHELFTYLSTSTPEGLEELKTKFKDIFGNRAGLKGAATDNAEEKVVVYEEGMSTGFAQSCRGYWILSYLGQPRVYVLNGGLMAWRKAGLPVVTDTFTPKPQEFVVQTKDAWMATMDDVKKVLEAPKTEGGKKTVLLDVRDKDEWTGESSSPYGKDFAPRKGRLAGSVWIEWYRFMKTGEDGVAYALSNEEIVDLLKSEGISQDDDIIVYCFKGSRASNTMIMLQKAGFKNLRNYFASWNEWSRYPELPIDDSVITSA